MFDSVPCDWSVLPLLHPTPTTPTAQFSLDNKPRRRKRTRKKWKRSDSSDSDSVELMAPLTTPTFDFHKVISSLSLKTPTTTPTPSLVKTSLKSSWFQLAWLRCREEYQISGVERTFCAYYSPSPLLFGFQVFQPAICFSCASFSRINLKNSFVFIVASLSTDAPRWPQSPSQFPVFHCSEVLSIFHFFIGQRTFLSSAFPFG